MEPVQERQGAAREPADHAGLLMGGWPAVVAGAHPPQQVPDQVAVQEVLLLAVVPGGEQVGDEGLEGDHDLVAFG